MPSLLFPGGLFGGMVVRGERRGRSQLVLGVPGAGAGALPPAPTRAALRSCARLRWAAPKGGSAPIPALRSPEPISGEPERWKGATAAALSAASRESAPLRLPRARGSCGPCVVASQMSRHKMLFVCLVFFAAW